MSWAAFLGFVFLGVSALAMLNGKPTALVALYFVSANVWLAADWLNDRLKEGQ